MQAYRDYRRERRKSWASRGKLKQSGNKGHPQFMSIWAFSEGYESYREATTGGFSQEKDLVYVSNLY